MEVEVNPIQKLRAEIKIVHQKVNSLQTAKQCCFFLGLTGSGKSTLISYLCGAEFSFKKELGDYLLNHNDPQKYPQIGNTYESCTSITSLYPMTKNLILYDPPGFFDTKGVHQEILNSYCNSKMFKVGIKAKIVIMAEISTLQSARGGAFVNVTKRLRQLFRNDFRQIVNSCVLVISKVHEAIMTLEDVVGNIQGIYGKNKNLSAEEIMLLKTLVVNKRVHLFPTPQTINDQVIKRIRATVEQIPIFHIDKETQVALSAQAKNCLEKLMRQQIEKEKAQVMDRIGKELAPVFLKDLQNKKVVQSSLLKLRLATKMIQGKQLESGIQSKFDQLGQKLSVKKEHIDKQKELLSQVKFCSTIYPDINLSTKISQLLLTYIASVQSELKLALEKIANKEEIQLMNQQHQNAMQNQQAKFREDVQRIERQAREQEEMIKKQAELANQRFQDEMDQLKSSHAAEMNKLNQQIQELKARPPIIIKKKRPWWKIF